MDPIVKVEKPILTDRLILRPFRMTDAEDVFEYASVDGVGQMARWIPHRDIEITKAWLKKTIENQKTYAITYRGKVIGTISINHSKEDMFPQFKDRECKSLGAVVSKDFWGKGFASEALEAVITWLFTGTQVDVLFASHYDFNERSARLQHHCGLHKLGETSEYDDIWKKDVKFIHNVLTKEEWLDGRWADIVGKITDC